MVLDQYRSTSDKYLSRYAKPFMKYDPNTLTMISLVFAVLAGVLYWASSPRFPYPLLLVPFALFANAMLDLIDGYVARTTNRTSLRGDFLDHVVDRYADMAILLGITFSPFCNNTIGLLAIIAILLVSYMGTQSQAVGVKRIYGGIIGRADRLAILTFLPWIQFALAYLHLTLPEVMGWRYHITDVAMAWFIIAGAITAIYRAWRTWDSLGPENVKEEVR